MNRKFGLIGLGLGVAAGSMVGNVNVALAQSRGLEEIVVTARKVEENLQVVPLSITAITAETIERASIRSALDIANITPGLTLLGDDLDRQQNPTIRGLNFDGGRGQEPNVAVFLDGVYLQNSGAISMSMMGMERVEVLKGPQSATYGHNAFSGAINFVTKAPPDKLEGGMELRAGDSGTYSAQASVGGPLVEGKVNARVGYLYDQYGGTFRDKVNGKRLGGWTKKDLDVAFQITPSDGMKFDIGLYSGNDRSGQPKAASFASNCGVFRFCGKLPEAKDVDLVVATRLPEELSGSKRNVKNGRFKGTFEYDAATVELIAGYFNVKVREHAELNAVRDGIPYALVGGGTVNLNTYAGAHVDNEDFSTELRISSPADQSLRWSFGGFYFKTNGEIQSNTTLDSNFIPAGRQLLCTGGANDPCNWLSAGGVSPGRANGVALQGSQQYSGFAKVDYSFNEDLSLTVEGRYVTEDKFSNILSEVTLVGTDPDGPRGKSGRFNDWNPRVALNYQLTDDNFLYVSAARGTKAGGFNAAGVIASELQYDPEKNVTYEIGSKNTFADGNVRLNLAAFYIDWTALQIEAESANPGQLAPVTQNFGSVEAKGGEAELQVAVADGVRINGGLAYTNPEFGNDTFNFNLQAECLAVGTKFCDPARIVSNAPTAKGPRPALSLGGLLRPTVSRWQLTGGFDISLPISESWNWFAIANYKYQSKQFTDVINSRWVGGRHDLATHLGVENDNVRMSFWVQNLLNDQTAIANNSGIARTRRNGSGRVPYAAYLDGRRLGVTLNVKM
jgi:iron complex outermembrane recepter protein